MVLTKRAFFLVAYARVLRVLVERIASKTKVLRVFYGQGTTQSTQSMLMPMDYLCKVLMHVSGAAA
jgi:hypothetical protein